MLCYITVQWLEHPSYYHAVMFVGSVTQSRSHTGGEDYGSGPFGYSMLCSFSKERKSVTAKTVNPLTAMLAARSLKTANKSAQFEIIKASVVQELCESRGGRPGLSVLTSLLVSVDVKLY